MKPQNRVPIFYAVDKNYFLSGSTNCALSILIPNERRGENALSEEDIFPYIIRGTSDGKFIGMTYIDSKNTTYFGLYDFKNRKITHKCNLTEHPELKGHDNFQFISHEEIIFYSKKKFMLYNFLTGDLEILSKKLLVFAHWHRCQNNKKFDCNISTKQILFIPPAFENIHLLDIKTKEIYNLNIKASGLFFIEDNRKIIIEHENSFRILDFQALLHEAVKASSLKSCPPYAAYPFFTSEHYKTVTYTDPIKSPTIKPFTSMGY